MLEQLLQRTEHDVDLQVAQALGDGRQVRRFPGPLTAQPVEQHVERAAAHHVGVAGVAHHRGADSANITVVLPLHQVHVPDLGVGVGLLEVVGEGRRVLRALGRALVALGDARVALLLLGAEVERAQAAVDLPHHVVVPQGVEAGHRRQVGVLGQLRRAALPAVLVRGLEPGLGGRLEVVAVVDQPHAQAVVRRLAVHRRRGVELLALLGHPQEVLVVLQHVVLEVVLLEDADAVEVALGQVLERPGAPPDLQQDLVAVEGPLALAQRLELVRHLLEQPLGRHQVGVAGLLPLLEAAVAQVEVDQRLDVGVAPEPLVTAGPLPALPRPAVLAPAIEGDGGEDVALLIEVALGGQQRRARLLQDPRLVQRRLVSAEGLGLGELAQVEQDVGRLTAVAQLDQRLGQAPHQPVVLLVDQVGLGADAAEELGGVLEAALLQQGPGLVALVGPVHP